MFNASEIRDVLKTKAHLLKFGLPARSVEIAALDELILEYRQRVGLATYLSEMLGELATVPVGECQLYWANGERVPISGRDDEPVQQFIRRRFLPGQELPFIVRVGERERYL